MWGVEGGGRESEGEMGAEWGEREEKRKEGLSPRFEDTLSVRGEAEK